MPFLSDQDPGDLENMRILNIPHIKSPMNPLFRAQTALTFLNGFKDSQCRTVLIWKKSMQCCLQLKLRKNSAVLAQKTFLNGLVLLSQSEFRNEQRTSKDFRKSCDVRAVRATDNRTNAR